jgi:hypothetical protein
MGRAALDAAVNPRAFGLLQAAHLDKKKRMILLGTA